MINVSNIHWSLLMEWFDIYYWDVLRNDILQYYWNHEECESYLNEYKNKGILYLYVKHSKMKAILLLNIC